MLRRILGCAAAIVCVALPGMAGDWLHLGADDVLSGAAQGEVALGTATVANVERRWGVGCDDGWFSVMSGTPAVRGETVYTSGAGQRLTAWNAATGSVLWQYGDGNQGWAPQPVVSRDGVVLYLEGSYPTRLSAVSSDTGVELWRAPIEFDLSFTDTKVPMVDEDRDLVYLLETPFSGDEGKLFALELSTGEIAWYMGQATDGMAFAGDVVLLDGGLVYTVAIVEDGYWTTQRVVAVDPDTRNIQLEVVRPSDIEYGDICRFSICGDSLLVDYCDRADVFESEGVLVAHDLATGAETWRRDLSGPMTGRAACNEALGRVYVPTDPYLLALDAADGAEAWRYLGYGAIYNPSLANGVVYFPSDTNLYAVDEATGTRLLHFPLGEEAYPDSQAAVADGRILVSGNGGTCDLFVLGLEDPPPGDGYDGVIPAAARNPGSGGTVWGTTLWAFQDSVPQATLQLRAGNSTTPAATIDEVSFNVARGRVVRIDDVLSLFPGLQPPGAVFYSWDGIDAADGVVTSRTFTAAPGGAPGTLGQGIPGIDVASLPPVTTSQVVPLSPREDLVRSNLGVAVFGNDDVDLLLRIHGADGSVRGQLPLTVPGGGWRQLNRVLQEVGVAAEEGLYAEVAVADPAAAPLSSRLAVFASVVDNTSGDPTFLAAQWADAGGEIIIPVAAHNPGVGGTSWVTDVSTINWQGDDHSLCSFDFLAEGVANAPDPAAWGLFSLDTDEHLLLSDVVESVFYRSNAKGAIRTADGESENRWSRTYNVGGGAGTYGQGMPGLRVADHAVAGLDHGLLIGLDEGASYRSNLGLVNTSDRPCTVQLELYDAAGIRLGVATVVLPPRGMEQISAPFAPYAPVRDGRITVTSDRGVLAYASVVDNATGDATTVLSRRLQ